MADDGKLSAALFLGPQGVLELGKLWNKYACAQVSPRMLDCVSVGLFQDPQTK